MECLFYQRSFHRDLLLLHWRCVTHDELIELARYRLYSSAPWLFAEL